MHDLILAKEIIDELEKISKEKNIQNIRKVRIEIGQVAMAHDGHPQHEEDILPENLRFNLKNISKNTMFEGTEFEIQKIPGHDWKITDIEV